MGVEVMGFEVVAAPGGAVDKSDKQEKENGKMEQELGQKDSIKFGSHGDEQVKDKENNVSAANFPTNAVEEWPEQKIHSFYFPKFRMYDDPKLISKLDHADRDLQKVIKERSQVIEKLKAARGRKSEVNGELSVLRAERKEFNVVLDEKKKQMEPLQQALGKIRDTNAGGLCSSEEELNAAIHSYKYRIQHESIPLSEEKQLLREIKQLEATRESVINNAAMRSKLQESLGQKDAIQDQVKNMGSNLDEVWKARKVITAKINVLDEKWKTIDNEIQSLQAELDTVDTKKQKVLETIQELRQQRDKTNTHLNHSRGVLNQARNLAAHKKIKDLEEFCNNEVESFMSQWNGKKAFRDDYEKRILGSLDNRQLSRDGRMRNPDEKLIVVREAPAPIGTEPVGKASVKRSKEEAKPSPQQDSLPTEKAKKEEKKRAIDSEVNDVNDVTEKVISKSQAEAEVSPAKKEIDVEKLKEMKREEEIAKAKQAQERKKKLADKAAAKAAIRAQKEAEKKEKKREEKAKKKAASNSAPVEEEVNEASVEASEPEKIEEDVEVAAPVKQKVQKEKPRLRNRARGSEALPRAILKRKKGTNYWVWAAPAAFVALVLLFLAYYYLL